MRDRSRWRRGGARATLVIALGLLAGCFRHSGDEPDFPALISETVCPDLSGSFSMQPDAGSQGAWNDTSYTHVLQAPATVVSLFDAGSYALTTVFHRDPAEFAAAGARVLGVSKDSVAAHSKFRAKHGLGIALLSDAEGDVCERYGVWVEKNMYGKTSMGIERATFLIDSKGVIRQIWRKVKAPGHAAAVLTAAKSL